MSIQRKTAVMISACMFAGSLLAAPTQAHEVLTQPTASGFQMAAVIDRAHGNAVVAGDYDQAIANLDDDQRYFESSTNLCVAYTMTGELEKADAECASALRISKRKEIRRDIAVALSNLGVLKAVSGDLDGAQEDFSRAIRVNRKLPYASENLQLLQVTIASEA